MGCSIIPCKVLRLNMKLQFQFLECKRLQARQTLFGMGKMHWTRVTATLIYIYTDMCVSIYIKNNYMQLFWDGKKTLNSSDHHAQIGDICVCCCHSEHGQLIIIIAVYISLRAVKKFSYENQLIYCENGSELLQREVGESFDDLAMILSGDFHSNIADDKNLPLMVSFE